MNEFTKEVTKTVTDEILEVVKTKLSNIKMGDITRQQMVDLDKFGVDIRYKFFEVFVTELIIQLYQLPVFKHAMEVAIQQDNKYIIPISNEPN